ncbi:2Fe-2S iron-sulfur cluster-binding protein [Acuticoccus mangrovi]|uniref:2Fe-2S iron-sulfur cluster binding domain-containing protein n=1 Tax=Acuticoccus mangrovi TaxID=2796142 RepID=A0A934MF95_9HYPH|nr:adenylate/guanylate cyclase domain-containing protein [Acuticoccus mangrovi]MBJ3775228.1 2Fe-2S iron-sulfur cluster binding domain-containing protein [Acuticoccus mangrovi]
MRRVLQRRPGEPRMRLVSGLILFAYATCHLVNHAFGLGTLAALQKATAVLLGPWQTSIGTAALYGAFVVHIGLGLRSIWRRRHLRIPPGEVWQMALGLSIPLFLIKHVTGTFLANVAGLEVGYPKVLYAMFVSSPDQLLPQQMTLLVIVWVHGIIGLHMWLRGRNGYRRWLPLFSVFAVLVPVLALVGVSNAGWTVELMTATDPALRADLGPAEPGTARAAAEAWVGSVDFWATTGYAGLVVLLLGLRFGREWYARRFHGVAITYPGQRRVVIPAGFTVLEASRWGGVAHAAVCGGRGRCSTCRVRILSGLRNAPPPGPTEAATLRRIAAAPEVRLACQLRPTGAMRVVPLAPAGESLPRGTLGGGPVDDGGREMLVTAVAVDMRDSTGLTAARLPYDAFYIVDRFIAAVADAIQRDGGEITGIAGDGVMSLFGIGGDAEAGARDAIAAARHIIANVERLNRELAGELSAPLRFGIGVHSGHSIVGMLGPLGQRTFQFLGDTGNIASRLEGLTKVDGTVVALSEATLDLLDAPEPPVAAVETQPRGLPSRLTARFFDADSYTDWSSRLDRRG